MEQKYSSVLDMDFLNIPFGAHYQTLIYKIEFFISYNYYKNKTHIPFSRFSPNREYFNMHKYTGRSGKNATDE